MSLIARLQENIVSRGLGGVEVTSGDPETCETILIGLEQVVTSEEVFYPLTGTYAGISGWKWNKAIPQSFDNIRRRIETSIGGYKFNLDEGSKSSDWYGGALSGLKLSGLKEFQDRTKRTGWHASIGKGSYSIFHKSKALNSKACISKVLSENIILEEECLENSLQINLFKRDRSLNNIPYLQYSEGLSNDKHFFYFEDSELLVSEVFRKKIGSSVKDKQSIECHSEYLGIGKSERNICYTEYFPTEEVEVFSIESNSLEEWTQVNSFTNSSQDDKHYILEDLKGIIIFPKKASEKILNVKNDAGNTIEFYQELNFLPNKGKIETRLGDITYYDKGKYKLYLSSGRQPSLNPGDKVKEKQLGKVLNLNEKLYANYTCLPRVDYDVVDTHFEDFKLNLKPYKKINSNGILELNVDEKNINKIKLSCDKPIIVSNIHGVLFVQSDATRVEAEVLNANGKQEEEIKVIFEASRGNFDGLNNKIAKVTNLSGIANTSYQYEYSDDALQIFTNARQIGNASYFEVNSLPPGISSDDVVIFQSLKTDPFYGSLGAEFEVEDVEVEGEFLRITLDKDILDAHEYKTLYTQSYGSEDNSGVSPKEDLNRNLCLDTYYNYGLAILEYDGVIKKSAIIRGAEKNQVLIEGSDENFLLPSKVSLFKRSELKFEANQESFHDRIMYKYDAVQSKYKPLKPTRIDGNRIYFEDTVLPPGSLTDNNTVIAGYKLFFPQLVSLKAYALNPATGFLISSNEIKIKVDFPKYLKGNDGLTFISDIDDEGSAFGGANFLTINPDIPNVLNIIVE